MNEMNENVMYPTSVELTFIFYSIIFTNVIVVTERESNQTRYEMTRVEPKTSAVFPNAHCALSH